MEPPTTTEYRKVYARTPKGVRLAATITVTKDDSYVLEGTDVETGEPVSFNKAAVARTVVVWS